MVAVEKSSSIVLPAKPRHHPGESVEPKANLISLKALITSNEFLLGADPLFDMRHVFDQNLNVSSGIFPCLKLPVNKLILHIYR